MLDSIEKLIIYGVEIIVELVVSGMKFLNFSKTEDIFVSASNAGTVDNNLDDYHKKTENIDLVPDIDLVSKEPEKSNLKSGKYSQGELDLINEFILEYDKVNDKSVKEQMWLELSDNLNRSISSLKAKVKRIKSRTRASKA